MNTFRLDRQAFSIQTAGQAAHQRAYWLQKSPRERLAAAWYLICAAWNMDHQKTHRLDRTAFAIKRRPA